MLFLIEFYETCHIIYNYFIIIIHIRHRYTSTHINITTATISTARITNTMSVIVIPTTALVDNA